MKRIWIQRIGAAVLCAVLLAGCSEEKDVCRIAALCCGVA